VELIIELTQRTKELINSIFNNEDQQAVAELLISECADNLPFCSNSTPKSIERLRFAVIKLSYGNVDRLFEALQLAQKDWRDLLMAADFGVDINAHKKWAGGILKNTKNHGLPVIFHINISTFLKANVS
jgi:hypothetical protein